MAEIFSKNFKLKLLCHFFSKEIQVIKQKRLIRDQDKKIKSLQETLYSLKFDQHNLKTIYF